MWLRLPHTHERSSPPPAPAHPMDALRPNTHCDFGLVAARHQHTGSQGRAPGFAHGVRLCVGARVGWPPPPPVQPRGGPPLAGRQEWGQLWRCAYGAVHGRRHAPPVPAPWRWRWRRRRGWWWRQRRGQRVPGLPVAPRKPGGKRQGPLPPPSPAFPTRNERAPCRGRPCCRCGLPFACPRHPIVALAPLLGVLCDSYPLARPTTRCSHVTSTILWLAPRARGCGWSGGGGWQCGGAHWGPVRPGRPLPRVRVCVRWCVLRRPVGAPGAPLGGWGQSLPVHSPPALPQPRPAPGAAAAHRHAAGWRDPLRADRQRHQGARPAPCQLGGEGREGG
jgi:hypothetical protein